MYLQKAHSDITGAIFRRMHTIAHCLYTCTCAALLCQCECTAFRLLLIAHAERLLGSSSSLCELAMQDDCKAARSPALLKRIRQAGHWRTVADPTAMPLASRSSNDAVVCSVDKRTSAPATRLAVAPRFTHVPVGRWRRICFSETWDAVLIALCTLIATAAVGAVLARLVVAYKADFRTRDSLLREAAYANAFIPPLPCGHSKGNASIGTQPAAGDRKRGATRRFAVVFFAAMAWVVLQSAFIFIVLPVSVDITFPYALEHTPVDTLVNLGPRSGDSCRTVEWHAGSVTRLEPHLIIRRCYSQYILKPGTGQYDQPNNLSKGESAFEMAYLKSDGHWRLTVPETATEFGGQAEFITIAYRPGRLAGSSLRLDARMDVGALEPYCAEALQNTSCPLLPMGAQACTTKTELLYTWYMRCSPDEAAKSLVIAELIHAFELHVDLRVAALQTADGFVSAVVRGRDVHDFTVTSADEFRSVLQAVTGPAVVARAATSRVNQLTASIIGLISVVVYLAAQVRAPPAAAEIALEFMAQRRGCDGLGAVRDVNSAGASPFAVPKHVHVSADI
jgi:hypothetical protein